MGRDRRQQPRVPVDWAAFIQHTGGGIVAQMENISANGAFLRCDKVLRPKERLKLHMVAPNHSTLSASAEVVWLHVHCVEDDIPPCGLGIRFTRVSRTDRQFLCGVAEKDSQPKGAQPTLTRAKPAHLVG